MQIQCRKCEKSDRLEDIIKCIKCDDKYHVSCLDTSANNLDAGDYFCVKCKDVMKEEIYEEDDTVCRVCDSAEGAEKMLLCDICDEGFHMYCLNPPLSKIPEDDWYCR